jgi:DNA-binding transcriptional ArsR family regulator
MSPTRRRTKRTAYRSRSPRELRRAVPLFAALGDNVRLGIVNRLCARGPMSTMRLSEGTGVTRQAVSKHLEVLEAAGVVRSMRKGRERLWEVDAGQLRVAQDWLRTISRDLDGTLVRLKEYVQD